LTFAEQLKVLRHKSGESGYKLAQYSGLSEAYIHRLESGERSNPSRDVVVMLGMALAHGGAPVEIWDIDTLLLSADYAPLRRRGEGAGAAPRAESPEASPR
jgi:transcriptional regulator with XRE-family HTH domain